MKNIARLRRVEREHASHEDVVAVRMDLERAAGRTVPRAVAARLLGVSQTAFGRWVANGDIPVVMVPSGRLEVPVRALVELIGAIDERGRAGAGGAHPLAAVLRERRSQARALKATAWAFDRDVQHAGSSHRAAELRGLLYHRAVARRLDDDLVRQARDRLARWHGEGRIHPRVAHEWTKILSRSPQAIARSICEDTPHMSDLRQSSPFAGALGECERRAVLDLPSRFDPPAADAG